MADVNKSLQDKLEKLKKKYDNSTLMDTEFISTGSIIADTVLVDSKLTKERGIEGGLPTSKYIEIYGESGTGKSTFVLYACKTACRKGHKVVYIDAEGGVNESQLIGIGLQEYVGTQFFLFAVDTFEEAEEVIEEI